MPARIASSLKAVVFCRDDAMFARSVAVPLAVVPIDLRTASV